MGFESMAWLRGAMLLGRARAASPAPDFLDPITTERRERLLSLAAIGITICSLPWLLFFGLRGDWLIASTHVLLLLGAVAVWICARRSAINTGMLVLSAVAWLGIACIAVAIDRPSGQLPRTVQVFLVPLMAAQAFLIDKRWLRRLMLLAGAAQFVAWSALPDLGIGTPPMGESERLGAAAMPLIAAWLLTGQVLRLQSRERREHTGLALDLAKAIAGDRLELHLQPQCDEQSRLVGAEALLRWRHDRLGMVSPTRFVRMAEVSGLILPMGEWVLRRALSVVESWRNSDTLRDLPIAVNVSALQLADEAAFNRILQLLHREDLPPGRIKLELTESVCADQPQTLQVRLQACRNEGVPTALDDFGTGYSSLAHLSQLPFDQLKIDQSFVRDLDANERNHRIAEAVVELGRDLGMAVIAEGVETKLQFEELLNMGCRQFQGYFFSKPLSVEAFEAWALQARNASPEPQS